MKAHFKYFIISVATAVLVTGCGGSRKLITDEVVLKDENSLTGTILKCDSANVKLKKSDESISVIPWSTIDTIQGKKYKTLWGGLNFGYYNTPYFSVFKNEAMTGKATGLQFKGGVAVRGNKLAYLQFSFTSSKPYAVKKFGVGFQRYFKRSSYLKEKSFFWGSEFNLMKAQRNNGPQETIEPFAGFEKKMSEQIRVHFKFGLQFNLANKNNHAGFNMTLGVHFMKRNFKKYYDALNSQHYLPKR